MAKTELAGPLVRKPKRGKTKTNQLAYQPDSVKPGIRHVIEGRDDLYLTKTKSREKRTGCRVGKIDGIPGQMITRTTSNKDEVDSALKGYKLEDEARSRLRTIPDADAARTAERKKAARRRMRGRLGTMLSGQRETLG